MSKQKTRAPKGTLRRALTYLRGYRLYLLFSLLLSSGLSMILLFAK